MDRARMIERLRYIYGELVESNGGYDWVSERKGFSLDDQGWTDKTSREYHEYEAWAGVMKLIQLLEFEPDIVFDNTDVEHWYEIEGFPEQYDSIHAARTGVVQKKADNREQNTFRIILKRKTPAIRTWNIESFGVVK